MSRRLDGGAGNTAEVPALPAPQRRRRLDGGGIGLRAAAILPIRLYQLLISPFIPANTCKFHPSCSEFAAQAIRKHGIFRGSRLAVWRLLRCHPWSSGGVDYP